MELLHPHGFFVFRRPLVPVDDIFSLLAGTAGGDALEERLATLFRQPPLPEAVYLASPALYDLMQAWLRGEPVPRKEKLLQTLLKYVLRAGVRCTPYGLFAGCTTVGYVGPRTAYAARRERPRAKRSRLDAVYGAGLVDFFVNHPPVRQALTYYPNDSLYRAADRYHYTYYQAGEGDRRYSVCSVEASAWLDRALAAGRAGATPGQLTEVLAAGGLSPADADDFVQQLIDEQVLVSELQPTVTGEDFLPALIRRLTDLDPHAPYLPGLREMHRLLDEEDGGVDAYRRVKDLIDRHFFPAEAENVVQTDVFFPATHTLGSGAVRTLTRTLEKLLVLDQGAHNPDLEAFKARFYARFGEREVALTEALDAELGVGYGPAGRGHAGHLPLLEDLVLPEPRPTTVEWNYWKDFVLEKYSGALLAQSREIELTDEDLAALARHHRPSERRMPASLAAFGNLVAPSAEAVDRGDFTFHLHALTGPSAVKMLSRFCPGDDELLGHLQQCVRAEEATDPDAIFAEIVHLPEGRAGNVLVRPALYRYEVPYLAKASVPDGYRIPLDDLLVSVPQGRRIVLRSRRHGKRVHVRLTSMHNFRGGLSLYQFLCDLQADAGALRVCWYWSILENQRFLPRVRYRNVILSRATWTLTTDQFPEFGAPGTDALALLAQRATAWGVPRYAMLAEHDNELLIDFGNRHCLALLRDELLRKGMVRLKELLQTPEACLLRDAAGRYPNEVVIPFRAAVPTPAPPAERPAAPPAPRVRRKFAPGSEWLYVKVYTGEKFADTLLRGPLGRMAEEVLAAGLADEWFFVRYADPDPHLRLRFHGRPADGLATEIMARLGALLDPHLDSGLVHRVQADTYDRELERYGPDTMRLSETLFCADSRLVAAFLGLLREESQENCRWLFALAAIDGLLDDFGYSPEARCRLLDDLRERFLAEFGGDGDLKRQLNEKFRRDAADVARCLDRDPAAFGPAVEAYGLLEVRSARTRPLADAIRSRVGGKADRLDALVGSYLHMFINRLFITHQRRHELVVYHYLARHYRSAVGKRRAARQPA